MLELNEDNFETEVTKSDVPVLVDFWAAWCGPCRMMAPVFEKLSGEFEGKVKFAKMNTDEQGELSQKFDIMGIPALVMFNKGQEVDRIVGFAPEVELKRKIEASLEKV